MKHIKSYKIFESVNNDIDDIMLELKDEGFKVEQSYWVRGARGGYLRSDEWGNQFYGPIATDTKIYLSVEVKKIEPPGNFLTKDGFNWEEAKSYFDRLRSFLTEYNTDKYKIKSLTFKHVPRFSIMKEAEMCDTYQTSFDYADSKYLEKNFTDKNTLTSVSYFFEKV
jgi:hypothetical protein